MTRPTESPTKRLPAGCYPAMVTVFRDDGSVDWQGVDRITDHCIDTGAAGLFACGLSAEVRWMDDQEKIALAGRVAKRAAGRVPIVAAALTEGPLATQIQLVRQIDQTGVDVVAVSVCQLAGENDGDPVWLQQAQQLLDQVPETVRLALYECPWPYWRLLTEETFRWAAQSGRFHFLKDTCCQIDRIRKRLEITGPGPLRLLNANTQTLLASLDAGAAGFCGIGANYSPELYNWLCREFNSDRGTAHDLQQFLTGCCDLTEGPSYPISAKYYLQQRGLAIGRFSRKPSATLPPETISQLDAMAVNEGQWRQRLGV